MGRYAVDGDQNAAAAISILGTTRGAAKRHKWAYLTIGSAATPDDQASNLQVNRTTTAGTGGNAPTPMPFVPAEGAAVTTAAANHSAEPTKTAGEILLSISHNSRANFQFYAQPGCELVAPDVANNGLVLVFIVATGTQLHEATVHFDE